MKNIYSWLFVLLVLAVPASRVLSQIVTCDEIQYYNPTTGAPESPHDGSHVIVEGKLQAVALTFDYKTFFIQDGTAQTPRVENSPAEPILHACALGMTILK